MTDSQLASDQLHFDQETSSEPQRSYFVPALALAALIALADQLTKLWILDLFETPRAAIEVLGNFFRLTLVYNLGGALGTNFGGPTLYLIMGLLIFSGLIYYLWNSRFLGWFSITLGLICGGAIGNLIDRVRLGKVVDWIDIDVPDISLFGYELYRFWTFNIADSAITVALCFLLWKYLRQPKQELSLDSTTANTSENPLHSPPTDSQSA